MKRFALAFIGFFLLLGVANAQTVNKTLAWNQAEPLATVQAFVYTIKIDTAVATQAVATCVAAVAPATGSKCTAPISFPDGPHTIILTAYNGFGTGTATLNGVPSSNPNGIILIVTFTNP